MIPHQPTSKRSQEIVVEAQGILRYAEQHFGRVKLPISVENARITRLSVFPEKCDPIQLLVNRSHGMQERGIQRQAPYLNAELRAYSGGELEGVEQASDLHFGQNPWTDNRMLAKTIDRNFPTILSFDIKRLEHPHRKGDFSVTVDNHGLNHKIWDIFQKTLGTKTIVNFNHLTYSSEGRIFFDLHLEETNGAYAALGFCQEALVAAHEPKGIVFGSSFTPLSIDTWELEPAVERFLTDTPGCQESFKAYDTWWKERTRAPSKQPESSEGYESLIIPRCTGCSITYC